MDTKKINLDAQSLSWTLIQDNFLGGIYLNDTITYGSGADAEPRTSSFEGKVPFLASVLPSAK